MMDLLPVGHNLRGPHVTRWQQLSIDIRCRRPTSATNPAATAAAVDRRDRQTDGRTLGRFMTLTAYCANSVNNSVLWCAVYGYS